MSNQLALGLADRDTGMALALHRQGIEGWKDRAGQTVAAMPPGMEFTADDLITLVGLPTGDPGQNANNAVGATMHALARRGVIVKTSKRVKAKRRESHARELTVWARAGSDPTPPTPDTYMIGYDAGVARGRKMAAEEQPDLRDILAAAREEGRRQAFATVALLANNMITAMPSTRPQTHHNKCWLIHPACTAQAFIRLGAREMTD